MKPLMLFLQLVACCINLYAQTICLFPVAVKNKSGYIDSSGSIVIAPRFWSAGEFSEGLAAVRENGRYGYINVSGEYILPPLYDYALPFKSGIAKVYIDGEPLFIDVKGKQVLPSAIKNLGIVYGHIAIATTGSRRVGMIDLGDFHFIADTIYGEIGRFASGLAVVEKYQRKEGRKKTKQGVIDTSGKLIVPFGVYDKIHPYSEGCARVSKGNYPKGQYGLIDTKGEIIYLRPYAQRISPDADYNNGLARFSTLGDWDFGGYGDKVSTDPDFNGFIDRKGNIVFADTTSRVNNDFSCGRVFIEKEEDRFFMYDTAFREIGPMNYSALLHGGFTNGLAIVRDNAYWGIIDTAGNTIVPFRYNAINGIDGNYFFHSYHDDQDERLYGIGTLSGETILPRILQDYDERGFVNGLLHGVIQNRQVYINRKGVVIWQQYTSGNKQLVPPNIDYMARGYCYAYTNRRGPGTGHGTSGNPARNLPRALPDSLATFPETLHLYIDTTVMDTTAQSGPGWRLWLVNHTLDTILLQAQDSRLYMNMQALDKKGVWRDIEYLPSSWCGNSYHTLALPGNHYWSFTIPRYEGEIETMLRVKLNLDGRRVRKHANARVIYSYPIRGTINPGQFWNKRGYRPMNFMDPYFE